LSNSTFFSIVANFLLKNALSFEFNNFSKVFHLKIELIFFAFSSQNFFIKKSFFSFSESSLKLFFKIKS
jgi:hypothetical protein